MQQEINELGSTIIRDITMSSLRCFEAMELVEMGNGWKFLGSSDGMQHHATWMNEEKRQIVTFCEGDVITKIAPTEQIFYREAFIENEFCIYG